MTAEELYQKEFGNADSIPKESVIRLLKNFARALTLERQDLRAHDVETRIDWISVETSLPEVGKDYLVTDGDACMVAAFRVEKQEWDFWSITWWSGEQVTHWMPLPKTPTQ
jgi:hypothetical protein